MQRVKRFFSLALAAVLTLGLAGCGAPEPGKPENLPETAASSQSAPTDNDAIRWAAESPDAAPLTVTETAYAEFAALAAQRVHYPDERLYQLNQALAMQQQSPVPEGTHSELICPIAELPSAEQILAHIQNNRAAALEKRPECSPPEAALEGTVARLAAEDLARCLPALSERDRCRIYCNLAHLSVLVLPADGENVNACVTGDLCLLVNLAQIAALPDAQGLEKTLLHEIQHVFQRNCVEVNGGGTRSIGPSQLWPELAVNSLWWNWLHEAAAERHTMTALGSAEPLVYPDAVEWLELLDFVALLSPDQDETALETAALSTDPQVCFAALGAQDEGQRQALCCLFYSIDCLVNHRADFLAAYRWDTGQTLDDPSLCQRLTPAVLTAVSRLFYGKLAAQVHRGNVTEADVLALIALFEESWNRLLPYDTSEGFSGQQAALEEYLSLQDTFFQMLESGKGVTAAQLVAKLDSFAGVSRTGDDLARGCTLTWLCDSERQFLWNVLLPDPSAQLTHSLQFFSASR